MTAFCFDFAKLRAAELIDLPRVRDSLTPADSLIWMLLNTTGLQADSTLNNYQTLDAILTAGNTECTATAYARLVLARGDITISVNTGTGAVSLAAVTNPVVFPAIGGATNNTMGRMLLCYRPSAGATNAQIKPLFSFDAAGSTSGQDFRVSIPNPFGGAS